MMRLTSNTCIRKCILIFYVHLLTEARAIQTQTLYGIDEPKYCPENEVTTKDVGVYEQVVLLARHAENHKSLADRIIDNIFGEKVVTECEMQFYPSHSDSDKKQYLEIKFDKFYIKDPSCDVKLRIDQSPAQFFDSKVQNMAQLGCGSASPQVLYTAKGNFVRLKFSRLSKDSTNYDFKITIARTDQPPEGEGLSIGVKIGIGVISAAAFVTILLLVVKAVKLKCEDKDIENASSSDRNHQRGLQSGSRASSYTAVPNGSDGDEHVLTDFPYANMPIVILDGNEAPPPYKDDSPPAYDEALQMPKVTESSADPTYSNLQPQNQS